jgi:putative ABC transport system ATP-binding protein
MPAFIEALDLHKTYHVGKIEVPALRGISFSIEKGEFVSVVGPSGSGKSTLFYLLGGLTRADSGHVVVDGDDFGQLSDAERTQMRKRKIGFVFQKFNLLPTLDATSPAQTAIATPLISTKLSVCWALRNALAIVLPNFPAENNSGWRWRGR